MRGKKRSHSLAEALELEKHEHEKSIRRIRRKFTQREKQYRQAFKKFRPRKRDRGSIVFVGIRGGRLPTRSKRRGYAIYVNGNGKKTAVRQLSRGSRHQYDARKLTTIDVSRVRSKRARTKFLTARVNPVARGELRKKRKGISAKGTRFAGNIKTDKFYIKSDSVVLLSKQLLKAMQSQKSNRDFLVTLGFWIKKKDGESVWVELQRRISRRDKQKLEIKHLQQFFGLEIYGFLARELSARGLVLEGSARHIGRLKDNRGEDRDSWTKDGFLWEGHDYDDVRVEKIEWRIDHYL